MLPIVDSYIENRVVFIIIFFFICRPPLRAVKGGIGELETRDGSESQNLNVEVVGSPHSLTVSRTEDADDGTSISPTKSVEMLTMSEDDSDPVLPTEYKSPVESNPAKDLVVGESKYLLYII